MLQLPINEWCFALRLIGLYKRNVILGFLKLLTAISYQYK